MYLNGEEVVTSHKRAQVVLVHAETKVHEIHKILNGIGHDVKFSFKYCYNYLQQTVRVARRGARAIPPPHALFLYVCVCFARQLKGQSCTLMMMMMMMIIPPPHYDNLAAQFFRSEQKCVGVITDLQLT